MTANFERQQYFSTAQPPSATQIPNENDLPPSIFVMHEVTVEYPLIESTKIIISFRRCVFNIQIHLPLLVSCNVRFRELFVFKV